MTSRILFVGDETTAFPAESPKNSIEISLIFAVFIVRVYTHTRKMQI